MAEKILILGNSGTGKSTSLRSLDPETTFIIQCVNKKLPFKGWKSKYTQITESNPNGNLCFTNDYQDIWKKLKYINNKLPKIKTVIIDDAHYLMTDDFMNRVTQKVSKGEGYEKYNQIAFNFHSLLKTAENMRDNINVFFLAHTQTDDYGHRSIKTVGRLLDSMIVIEGLVSIILESSIKDGKYVFQTNKKDGTEPCKSPMGMFEELFIDNDLQYVIEKINEYDN